MKKTRTDQERFHASYEAKPSGCWEWKLKPDRDGYALFSVGSDTDGTARRVRAARWACQEFVADVPVGYHVDHLCRNRICVNPAHLEPVTPLENSRRGANPNRPFCPHGHQMTVDNTYVHPKTGNKSCRECRRNSIAEYRQKIGTEAVNTYQREWDKMNRRRKRATATS